MPGARGDLLYDLLVGRGSQAAQCNKAGNAHSHKQSSAHTARASASVQEGTWYRGKWHTRADLNAMRNCPVPTTATLPRSTRRPGTRQRPFRPEHHIRVLSWNTGGLSSSLLQEFLAWCDTRQAADMYDVVILVETHWRHVRDYRSGHWLCIHSTGYRDEGESDKYAGILCLLSGKCFSEPRVKEHTPGRLLQVIATHTHSQLPASIVGIYQHVWRPHLGAQKNRELRSGVWNQLQQLITHTPARHQLIIAGDLNATLRPMYPHVGPAAPDPTSHSNLRLPRIQLHTPTWIRNSKPSLKSIACAPSIPGMHGHPSRSAPPRLTAK